MTTHESSHESTIKITTQPGMVGHTQPPPICRDFLKGKCIRKNCKYLHTVAVYKPNDPIPILSQLFIPNKGNVFVNLTNLAQQQYYNGLFLCNLGEIISTDFIEKLLATCYPRSGENLDYYVQENIRTMVNNEISIHQWPAKMLKVIDWANTNFQLFDKTHYSTIFLFDISHAIQNWVFKYILNCMNIVFTCIYENMSPHVSETINLYISYMNDELSLTNRGSFDFIYRLCASTPGKYVANYFNSNIYYIGELPNLDEKISSPVNTGFVYSYITASKYINLKDIINDLSIGESCDITWQGDIQTCHNINEYNTELMKYNTIVYKNLFEKNAEIKTALSEVISFNNIRDNSLLIIGCNLDVEFDKGLVAGLKETIGAIDFTGRKASNGQSGKNKATASVSGNTTKTNSCAKPDDHTNGGCCDDTPITTTMSIIMPNIYIPPGNSNNSSSQSPSSTQLNEIMRELLGGMLTGGKLNGNGKTSNIIQNRICTIGINLIKSFDGTITTNQPFDTITGIEKIKEYGLEPANKIIILCSPRMTHEFFTGFIKQITRTPGYPVRISANFIDFNINPSLRKCLAYHNYRKIRSAFTSSFSNEVPITQMCNIYQKFKNYLNSVDSYESIEFPGKNSITHKGTATDTFECCTCCSCLSRNGIGYTKFGNIPYIPLDQLKLITDDSWLPRY